jgi:TonB family protein
MSRNSLVRCIVGFGAAIVLCCSSIAQAQSQGSFGIGNNAPWLPDLLEHSSPEYPYEARSRNWQGTGIFRLTLDHNTGGVTNVEVTKSTGFPMLDQSSIQALRKWRLKPGKWQKIYVPIIFRMGTGRSWSAADRSYSN